MSGIPSPPNQRPSWAPVPAQWSKHPFSRCPSSDQALWSLFTPFLFPDPSATHVPSLNRVLLRSSPLLSCVVHSDPAPHTTPPHPRTHSGPFQQVCSPSFIHPVVRPPDSQGWSLRTVRRDVGGQKGITAHWPVPKSHFIAEKTRPGRLLSTYWQWQY